MDTLLYSELDIFSIVILLIIAVNSSLPGFERKTGNNMFIASVIFSAAANLFDLLWNISTSKYITFPVSVVWSVNFMYFFSFGCSAFFWYMFFQMVSGSNILKSKMHVAISLIPLALLTVLLFATIFNGCLYSIDENNVYHRGPLFFLQPVLCYAYVAYTSLKALIFSRSRENFLWRNDFLTIATFAVPPLACVILQMLIQEIPILSAGIAISFLLVYICSLQGLVSVDPLTGLNNRRQLLTYLSSKIKSLDKNERLYFILLDIDMFKQINDTYGHNEGDKAIVSIAAGLREACKKTNGFCARYGGDEFAVVQTLNSGASIDAVIKRIKWEIKNKTKASGFLHPIEISMGCAEYTKVTSDIQELIMCADSKMYKDKADKKK